MLKKTAFLLTVTALFGASATVSATMQPQAKNPFVTPSAEMVVAPVGYNQHLIPKPDFEKKLATLVDQASNAEARIVGYFQGPGGMTGVMIKGPNEDSQTIIGWVPPGIDYLMVGSLFDRKGDDLTKTATEAFIDNPQQASTVPEKDSSVASEPTEGVEACIGCSDTGVEQFDIKEPTAVVYVFVTPDCYYCRNMYRTVNKLEEDFVEAKVQVRWLMVGFDKSTIRNASAILASGIDTPWTRPGAEPQNEHVQQVFANSNLLLETVEGEDISTPTMVWVEDGKDVVHGSSMDEKELKELIGKLSK